MFDIISSPRRGKALTVSGAAVARSVAARLLRMVDEEIVVRGIRDLQSGLCQCRNDSRVALGATIYASDYEEELHPNHTAVSRAILDHARLQSVGNWIQSKIDDVMTESGIESGLKNLAKRIGKLGQDETFRQARELIDATYSDIDDVAEELLAGVARAVADKRRKLMLDHHGVKTGTPELAGVDQSNVMGATLREHFEKQAADLLFRFKATMRLGLDAGEGPDALEERISGAKAAMIKAAEPSERYPRTFGQIRRGEPGTSITEGRLAVKVRLLDGAENSVSKVIQNAIQSFASKGALAAGEAQEAEDGDAGEGEATTALGWQWVAVLDDKTCDQCQFYDGSRWTNSFDPVDDGPDFPGQPGLHINCRCTLVPTDTGDAPAPARDFDDYLADFSRSEQEEAFGKENLRAYHRGDITAAELIGQEDNMMTLEQFREADDV